MANIKATINGKMKEIIYQVVVTIFIFLAFTITRTDPQITSFETVTFISYVVVAFFINYWVLPHYYKKQNIYELVFFCILGLYFCIVLEEVVLEPLFFPEDIGGTIRLFWTIMSVLPILSLLVVFKLVWDMVIVRRELDEIKLVAKQNELQFLQTQINPHFLFNNLNNIYSFSLEGSPKTSDAILGLSEMMRYILYECKEDYISLSRELEQLENFIELNKLQLEHRGKVQFESIGNVSGYKITPLILMVFVENAFKHSTSSLSDGIQISIKNEITNEGNLLFTCKNNYSKSTNTIRLSKGIGLANVKKRLDLIYNDTYSLENIEENDTYTVRLTLPLQEID